eukprot:TRINITY_DN7131_c0_g1_i5.p1 TRINITY_DN7131_c0_g1~~TRINITY_DN7131_c0_g1_i5.p1  ORF type:complete len:266 (+),score=63.75 TRINITY_DN7131_c0_g1_i5:54-851(+)
MAGQSGAAGLLVYVEHQGTKAAVHLDPSATVADLQTAAAEAFDGLGVERAALLFRGEPLGRPSTELADTGLSSECVVHVQLDDAVRWDPESATDSAAVSDDRRSVFVEGIDMYSSVHAAEPVRADGCSHWGVRLDSFRCQTNVYVGVVPAQTESDVFDGGMAHNTSGAQMLMATGAIGPMSTPHAYSAPTYTPVWREMQRGDRIAMRLRQHTLTFWSNGVEVCSVAAPLPLYYPAVQVYCEGDRLTSISYAEAVRKSDASGQSTD